MNGDPVKVRVSPDVVMKPSFAILRVKANLCSIGLQEIIKAALENGINMYLSFGLREERFCR